MPRGCCSRSCAIFTLVSRLRLEPRPTPISQSSGGQRSLAVFWRSSLARRGLRIGIVTKSSLIARDIDLLEKIAERNELVIHLTITTPDAALARILEPRAPRPDLRLRTVAKLRRAGLRAGILCSPLLPGLTDTLEALDAMARRAKAVDASFFAAEPLFLKPCSRETYLAFVREHFPNLESLYRFRFDGRDFVAQGYRKRIEALVALVIAKHGLNRRRTEAMLPPGVEEANRRGSSDQTELWPERKPPWRTLDPASPAQGGGQQLPGRA